MGRKHTYAPNISWEDVSTYVREHEAATGYTASIILRPEPGPNGDTYAEVHLRPSGAPLAWSGGPVTRGPFPRRQMERQMSFLLHLVVQAYEDLSRNPWLWTPEQRAAARGEIG